MKEEAANSGNKYLEEAAFSRKERLKEMAKGISLCAVVSAVFYRSLAVFIASLPLGLILWPKMQKKKIQLRMKKKLNNDFREGISIVSGYLSAGYSVENAFLSALSELKKLVGENAVITEEFSRIIRGQRLNKQVEDLLMDFAVRSGLPDIKNFAEVFTIAKRSGGNLREIIESTVNVISEKTAVNEEILNITASKRYEQKIMNLIPFGIILYVSITTGEFMNVLYETAVGRIVMTVCLMLIGLSAYLSEKILDIKI